MSFCYVGAHYLRVVDRSAPIDAIIQKKIDLKKCIEGLRVNNSNKITEYIYGVSYPHSSIHYKIGEVLTLQHVKKLVIHPNILHVITDHQLCTMVHITYVTIIYGNKYTCFSTSCFKIILSKFYGYFFLNGVTD